MSIKSLSSKRFTQKSMYRFTLYRTSVIILTTPPLHPHIHSIVKLCRKGVSQTKREAFFKKMYFQIFLERGERWRAIAIVKAKQSVRTQYMLNICTCYNEHGANTG